MRQRQSLLLCGALSLLAAAGCGPQFDPGNEIKTLRVLGVKKDKPYALPGDEVSLQLLWHDPKGRKDVQRAFIGGCVNPPGDLYYGCFGQYGQSAAQGQPPELGLGDSFKIKLPKDIISSRPPLEPGQPPYGLYIVFFAVCAGTISFDMSASAQSGSSGLPVRCLDDDGAPLGSEDFVVGYSSIYSFEDATNTNPAFELDADGRARFEVAGNSLLADCVGEACQGAAAVEVDCDAEPERCVEACADDGDAECPDIEVKPGIAENENVELDDVSSRLFGNNVTEQMWVNYYVDRGGMSQVRLLNDATTGWNAKYRGELHAPKDAGPLQIWSVIHDNRGGMEFARLTLGVTAK
jgi:hypothetical protein